MKHIPRLLLLTLLLGVPLGFFLAESLRSAPPLIRLSGSMPEAGGWSEEVLDLQVGEQAHLLLTSADVIHGFAIGKTEVHLDEIKPGEWRELRWTPQEPGEYTFYCTRWCGPNHWRMTGKIRVTDAAGEFPTPGPAAIPRFVSYGVDIDHRHTLNALINIQPSAAHGEQLGIEPSLGWQDALDPDLTTPQQAWDRLRRDPAAELLSDEALWDWLAWLWLRELNPAAVEEGRQLFAANCAACHGSSGEGDGVMALHYPDPPPANFTSLPHMGGASSVHFEGKILRGGMGTSMPYWGGIFHPAQISSLIDFLWSLVFNAGQQPG